MKYIMCAKTFPVYHPRAGQPTGFRESILSGRKIHTLRQSAGNRKTGDTVSLREWSGRPYASKQVEFATCSIAIHQMFLPIVTVDGMSSWYKNIVYNDGFDRPEDFVDWFTMGPNAKMTFEGVRIYFIAVMPVTTARIQ